MPYEPFENRGKPISSIKSKILRTIKGLSFIFSFNRYKKNVLNFVKSFKPDILIITTDMFFTPRYISENLLIFLFFNSTMLFRFMGKPYLNEFSKKIINIIQPYFYEKQQYFGFEILKLNYLFGNHHLMTFIKKKEEYPQLII